MNLRLYKIISGILIFFFIINSVFSVNCRLCAGQESCYNSQVYEEQCLGGGTSNSNLSSVEIIWIIVGILAIIYFAKKIFKF